MAKGIRNIDRGEMRAAHAVERIEESDYTYTPPGLLDMPTFGDEDQYAYRWVRTVIGNEEDTKNIMMRLREGWTFVRVEDLPDNNSFHLVSDQRGSALLEGVVRIGDVALAKIPRKKALAYKRYVEGLADQQNRAVSRKNLQATVDDQQVLLDNDSRSMVTRGKPVKFAD